VPWYVTKCDVMVSLNFTTHLHDATMVKCYINAYHSNPEIIKQVVDKITGESKFKGTRMIWCGPASGRRNCENAGQPARLSPTVSRHGAR